MTILNIKGYVFLHNFFCMNSVQCYLSEVAGKSSAESLKNAFECCLWAEMMRNEYSQSLIINFSLSWQYWHLLVSAQMDESQLMSCFDHLQCKCKPKAHIFWPCTSGLTVKDWKLLFCEDVRTTPKVAPFGRLQPGVTRHGHAVGDCTRREPARQSITRGCSLARSAGGRVFSNASLSREALPLALSMSEME